MNLFGLLSFLFAVPVPAECLTPEPTQCARDALVAEATWHGFPGFRADLKIELNGKTSYGRLVIEPGGRLLVEQMPESHRAWAVQHLGCAVRQRLPRPEMTNKKWVFASLEEKCDMPLCRADAPFGPILWIQNQRILAMECRTAKHKQRLTTLKTQRNQEQTHLPTVQVHQRWHAHMMTLEFTETTLLSWRRVGRFDLPATIEVVSADSSREPAIPTIGRIVLSGHQLFASRETLLASR